MEVLPDPMFLSEFQMCYVSVMIIFYLLVAR